MTEEIVFEESPVGESQSNGAVESQVKEIRGMYKTIRSDMESNYGKVIPGNHPIQPCQGRVKYFPLAVFRVPEAIPRP